MTKLSQWLGLAAVVVIIASGILFAGAGTKLH